MGFGAPGVVPALAAAAVNAFAAAAAEDIADAVWAGAAGGVGSGAMPGMGRGIGGKASGFGGADDDISRAQSLTSTARCRAQIRTVLR